MWHTGLIKDYQKQRLVSFLDPEADPRGSDGTPSSRIAIGSGGLTGKGLLRGTQARAASSPSSKPTSSTP